MCELFTGIMLGSMRPQVPPDCDPEWVQLMQVRPGCMACLCVDF